MRLKALSGLRRRLWFPAEFLLSCRPHHLGVAVGKPDDIVAIVPGLGREQFGATAHIPAAVDLEDQHGLSGRLDLFCAAPGQLGVESVMAPLVRCALRTNKNVNGSKISFRVSRFGFRL